jgi:hypothetical protein
MEELLGSEEGLKALAAILKASGAFTKTGRPQGEYMVPTWEDYIAPRNRGEEAEAVEEGSEQGEDKDEDKEEARRC